MLIESATEFDTHKFCIGASDLGIRPGDPLPKFIPTSLGNGEKFMMANVEYTTEGDLSAVVYVQMFGCTQLHILND